MSLVRPICIPSADLEESMLKAQREKVKVNGIKELTEKAKQLKKCYRMFFRIIVKHTQGQNIKSHFYSISQKLRY